MKCRLAVFVWSLCAVVQFVSATFPDGYYDKANGKSKAALKSALHDIIRTASVLGYGGGDGRTWSEIGRAHV